MDCSSRDHQERLNHSRTADSGDSASECKGAETTLAPSRVESVIVEQEKASMDKSKDQDRGKGAIEQDQQNQSGNASMPGQLGHRDEIRVRPAVFCGLLL